MATFGERLKFLRDQKGVTQEDLAELLGVNKQTISGYERGVRRPAGETSLEVYEKLADYFNVDMMYLLGQSDMVVRLCGEGVDPENADILLEVTPKELEILKAYRLASYDTKLAACAGSPRKRIKKSPPLREQRRT